MSRVRLKAAAVAFVAAVGLLVGPTDLAHAERCPQPLNPSIRIGPKGCFNPVWRPEFRDHGPGGHGDSHWPPHDAAD